MFNMSSVNDRSRMGSNLANDFPIIQEKCSQIEIAAVALAALGCLSLCLGAPALGLLLVIPSTSAVLLCRDIKVITQNAIKSGFINKSTGAGLPQNEVEMLINFVDTLRPSLSFIGKVFFDATKESFRAGAEIRLAQEEVTAATVLGKVAIDSKFQMPNFDRMRLAGLNGSLCIKALSKIAFGFSSSIIVIGLVSLVSGSIIPGALVAGAGLVALMTTQGVSIKSVVVLFLASGGLLYLGAGAVASVALVALGGLGLVLSNDLKKLSENVTSLVYNKDIIEITAPTAKLGNLGTLALFVPGWHGQPDQRGVDPRISKAITIIKATLPQGMSPIGQMIAKAFFAKHNF